MLLSALTATGDLDSGALAEQFAVPAGALVIVGLPLLPPPPPPPPHATSRAAMNAEQADFRIVISPPCEYGFPLTASIVYRLWTSPGFLILAGGADLRTEFACANQENERVKPRKFLCVFRSVN